MATTSQASPAAASRPAAPQVRLRFKWRCDSCRNEGVIASEPTEMCDVTSQRIDEDHRRRAPGCPKPRVYTERLENEYLYPVQKGGTA